MAASAPPRTAASRQRPRFELALDVRWRTLEDGPDGEATGPAVSAPGPGRTLDLHEEGLFLTGPGTAELAPGTALELTIELPADPDDPEGSARRPVSTVGRVIHQSPGGCGVRFSSLAPSARAALTELVRTRRHQVYAALLLETQSLLRGRL